VKAQSLIHSSKMTHQEELREKGNRWIGKAGFFNEGSAVKAEVEY
jgi:hypothetical protein